MKLDFSEFHPLDHSLLNCRGYPGGPRRHLQHRWRFQWSEDLDIYWKHLTRRHSWAAYAYKRDDGWRYAAGCRGCRAVPDQVVADRLIMAMKARHPEGPPDFAAAVSVDEDEQRVDRQQDEHHD